MPWGKKDNERINPIQKNNTGLSQKAPAKADGISTIPEITPFQGSLKLLIQPKNDVFCGLLYVSGTKIKNQILIQNGELRIGYEMRFLPDKSSNSAGVLTFFNK